MAVEWGLGRPVATPCICGDRSRRKILDSCHISRSCVAGARLRAAWPVYRTVHVSCTVRLYLGVQLCCAAVGIFASFLGSTALFSVRSAYKAPCVSSPSQGKSQRGSEWRLADVASGKGQLSYFFGPRLTAPGRHAAPVVDRTVQVRGGTGGVAGHVAYSGCTPQWKLKTAQRLGGPALRLRARAPTVRRAQPHVARPQGLPTQ